MWSFLIKSRLLVPRGNSRPHAANGKSFLSWKTTPELPNRSQVQCWKTKLYMCKNIFFFYKQIYNFWQVWSLFIYRPAGAVWCAVPDLLLLEETQKTRHICELACLSGWFCWFSCWLTTEMMSGINLLIMLRIDWQTCCLTALHGLTAFPLFSALYGVAFRPSVHLKAPLEMRFAAGLWNWNQEQEFTICFCQPKPLMVTVWCCVTHISRRFCFYFAGLCWWCADQGGTDRPVVPSQAKVRRHHQGEAQGSW